MAFVNIAFGTVLLAVTTAVLWAFTIGLEILIKSVGLDFMKYLLPLPVILIFAYFIGSGFQQYRTIYGKQR